MILDKSAKTKKMLMIRKRLFLANVGSGFLIITGSFRGTHTISLVEEMLFFNLKLKGKREIGVEI